MTTSEAMFSTPHSRPMRMIVRDGTSDWNTVQAITSVGDEYHLQEGLSGWGLDVGSHIGAWAIAFLLDNPGTRVVAIEALPENADLIEQNAALNGVDGRLRLIRGAASNSHEPVRIGYGADTVHDYIGNASAPAGNREVSVEGWTLADVLETFGIEEFVAVKIDCEGCECTFLGGAFRSDLMKLAYIEGEVHPECGGETLAGILADTHDTTFPGWEANPDFGPFTATRR